MRWRLCGIECQILIRAYKMYDLYNLGWHSFQELCLTITREILGQTVESFLDSSDAGKDGAFAGCSSPIRCARHEKDFFLLSASSSVWDCRLIRRPAKDARRKREPCLGRVTSENGS